MTKNNYLLKVRKIAALMAAVAAMVSICASCGSKSISYLDAHQNDMLGSARPVEGSDFQAYEINYTADYKIDEFIETITQNMFYSSSDCRITMKKLLADGSSIIPTERLSNGAPGCSSVICKNSDGVPVIGRNYDLDIRSNSALVVVHTAPEGGYKSVGIADCGQCGLSVSDLKDSTKNKELLLYSPYFTMDGVNEKGFACSIMLLNEGANVQYTEKNWLPSTLVVRYLLDKADSVDSAIDLLNNMDLRNDYLIDPLLSALSDVSFHWALTDASGDKAIIEYIDGEMVVNEYPLEVEYNEQDDTLKIEYPKEEKGYLISTNFYVSKGFNNTKHDSGKWRYSVLEKQMSANSTPTKDELRDIMKSAKYFMNDKDYIFEMNKMGLDPGDPEKWDWITLWTDILNTSEKSLTLWVMENYDAENTFGIDYQP